MTSNTPQCRSGVQKSSLESAALWGRWKQVDVPPMQGSRLLCGRSQFGRLSRFPRSVSNQEPLLSTVALLSGSLQNCPKKPWLFHTSLPRMQMKGSAFGAPAKREKQKARAIRKEVRPTLRELACHWPSFRTPHPRAYRQFKQLLIEGAGMQVLTCRMSIYNCLGELRGKPRSWELTNMGWHRRIRVASLWFPQHNPFQKGSPIQEGPQFISILGHHKCSPADTGEGLDITHQPVHAPLHTCGRKRLITSEMAPPETLHGT